MFHSTLPPIYFSATSTLVLAASTTGMRPPSTTGHALGVCEIMDSSSDQELSFSPITGLQVYLALGGKKDQPLIDPDDAKVDIVRQPRHGHIELLGDWSGAEYVPDEDYVGNDSFVVQIKVGENQLEIRYYVTIDYQRTPTDNYNKACKGAYWKIAAFKDGMQPDNRMRYMRQS